MRLQAIRLRSQEFVHLAERRHRRYGAQPGAAEGRGRICEAKNVGHRPRLQQSVDEPRTEHVAGAGAVNDLHLERRHNVKGIAVERDRSQLSARHDEDAAVQPPQLPQRALRIAFAGDRRRQILLEDGIGDRRNQPLRVVRHVLEIARDDHAGIAGGRHGIQRQLRVVIVHMDDARSHRRRRQSLERQLQPVATVPENRAIAPRIDEDHRTAVRRIAFDRVAHVDTGMCQRISDQPSMLVRSERPDVPGAQPQRGARGHYGRRLPTAQESPITDAHLAARRHHAEGHLQYFVDRVGAYTYYIQHWKIGRLEDWRIRTTFCQSINLPICQYLRRCPVPVPATPASAFPYLRHRARAGGGARPFAGKHRRDRARGGPAR